MDRAISQCEFRVPSVMVTSYTGYYLKKNYTHNNVNSKIRSVSADLYFFSRKNYIPFCLAIKNCLKPICHISGNHLSDVIQEVHTR